MPEWPVVPPMSSISRAQQGVSENQTTQELHAHSCTSTTHPPVWHNPPIHCQRNKSIAGMGTGEPFTCKVCCMGDSKGRGSHVPTAPETHDPDMQGQLPGSQLTNMGNCSSAHEYST